MRRSREKIPAGLNFVTAMGGHTRPHRYLAHLRIFLWPSLVSVALQVATYLVSVYPRISGESLFIATISLGAPVVIGAMVLAAFRRHDSPILSAGVVFSSLFFAMATILSATRMPLSYQALAICGMIGIVLACLANHRFHKIRGSSVRILPFDGAAAVAERIPGARVLAPAEISRLQTEIDFDVLLVSDGSFGDAESAQFISQMHILGIDVVSYKVFLERATGSVDVDKFEFHHVVYSPSQLLYARLKRYLDLACVVLFFPIIALLCILTAIYIYVRDPGPILFIQIRRGYGNRPFRMYKFRTMYQGTSGGSTVERDQRIIPGCSSLRKLRIDELPQCLNILKGEMSLIGPRPVAEYVARASILAEPKYAYRCAVPPGITGWAQVTSGYATSVDEELTKLSYDLYYIKRFSIDLDLVILIKTVRTILARSGAK